MADIETFESTDAGASETIPMEAGQIRKGGYICIKGRPCKVTSVSTSKTGKHGHAKCNFVATDIFNGKKLEDIVPSSHGTTVPNVFKSEYSLLDISDEDYLTLMTDNGETREDLKMPSYPSELEEQIRNGFEQGEQLILGVVKAMGEEHVMSCKKDNS
jgi:translation initiation factor 5A|tara:strand:- start:793 stop:1266 length:474 start_codon:yes stop_codon:yes gene_type:complete